MEQTGNRKKIIWLLIVLLLGGAGTWFWQQSNGALFSPTPTVAEIPVDELTAPQTGSPTDLAAASDPVRQTTAAGVTQPDVPEIVQLETTPAGLPATATAPVAPLGDAATSALPKLPPADLDAGTPRFDLVRVEKCYVCVAWREHA